MSSRKPSPPKPLTRKRQQTRQRILDAAAQVFHDKGYERATLEEIAARAGLTKGAVYSNFKNKNDLIFEGAMSRGLRAGPVFKKGLSASAQMRRLADAFIAMAPKAVEQMPAVTAFHLYALTHEDLRERLAKAREEAFAQGAREVEEFLLDAELPVPPLQFVAVVNAVISGLFQYRTMHPHLITDDVIVAVLQALAPPKQNRRKSDGRSD